MDNQEEIEKRFDRARNLLGFMSKEEVIAHLVGQGEDPSDAFLAVTAAVILGNEPDPLEKLWW